MLFCAGNMELCWLYAILTFFIFLINGQLFPPLEAFVFFWLVSLLVFLSDGRGLMIIQIILLHLVIFIGMSSRIFYILGYRYEQLYLVLQDPIEFSIFVLIFAALVTVWAVSFSFARRSISYNSITDRFDKGIFIFFILFLIKALMELEDPNIELLFLPYFFFAILTISIVRDRGDVQKDFIKGYRGFGLVFFFAVIIVSICGSLFLFFLPHLTMAAQKSYLVFKGAAEPLLPYLEKFLRFIFGFLIGGNIISDTSTPPTDDQIIEGKDLPALPPFMEMLLNWIFYIGIAVVIILLTFAFIKYLVPFLMQKTARDKNKVGLVDQLLIWIKKIFQRLKRLIYLRSGLTNESEVVKFYRRLVKWGSYSGVKYRSTDTPLEYGKRLAGQFPDLKEEIEIIINSFNKEVYASETLKPDRVVLLKRSWRKLKKPVNYPKRFKHWFM